MCLATTFWRNFSNSPFSTNCTGAKSTSSVYSSIWRSLVKVKRSSTLLPFYPSYNFCVVCCWLPPLRVHNRVLVLWILTRLDVGLLQSFRITTYNHPITVLVWKCLALSSMLIHSNQADAHAICTFRKLLENYRGSLDEHFGLSEMKKNFMNISGCASVTNCFR